MSHDPRSIRRLFAHAKAMSFTPAYSTAFDPEQLELLKALLPMDDITPEWAWGGATGRGVKVAVVDSGVDADHPVIAGRIAGYTAITVSSTDELSYDDAPHEDASGHGTACAGIILDIAPDCELYSVRVMGKMGGKGAALVTAANNFPIPSFPCEYASVVSVGSHATNDPFLYYYNPAPPTEFGAFGIDVPCAWKGGGISKVTGNSVAAPHITGIVARILEKHPSLTVFQVKAILRALAANVARSAA